MLAVLLPLGLVLIALALAVFWWAVKSGQFDDLDAPAWRIVLDEDRETTQAPTARPPDLQTSDPQRYPLLSDPPTNQAYNR